MGKGQCSDGGVNGHLPSKTSDILFTWEEVSEHCKPDSRWIVVDNCVYDVTIWQKRHPGGARIISHFSGQDATVGIDRSMSSIVDLGRFSF